MRVGLLLVALMAAAATAGCLEGGAPAEGTPGPTTNGTPTATTGPPSTTAGPPRTPGSTASPPATPGPNQPPATTLPPDPPAGPEVPWVPEWASLDSAPLRPGAAMTVCTFDWLFVDPVTGSYYVGIAAHCTEGEGERIELVGRGDIGTVVFDSDNETLQLDHGVEARVDFSLIRLDDGVNRMANPQMIGAEGPTGVAGCDEAAEGDTIRLYGHGLLFGEIDATRSRDGVLVTCDGRDYGALTNAIYGDSGGPVLHLDSGAAFGIVSRLGLDTFPFTELTGATLPYILRELAKVPGFGDVALATVDGGYVGLDG